MANKNETVNSVCAEIQLQTYQTMFRASDVIDWRDHILAAHDREILKYRSEACRADGRMTGMSLEICKLRDENKKLRKELYALKPVMNV